MHNFHQVQITDKMKGHICLTLLLLVCYAVSISLTKKVTDQCKLNWHGQPERCNQTNLINSGVWGVVHVGTLSVQAETESIAKHESDFCWSCQNFNVKHRVPGRSDRQWSGVIWIWHCSGSLTWWQLSASDTEKRQNWDRRKKRGRRRGHRHCRFIWSVLSAFW